MHTKRFHTYILNMGAIPCGCNSTSTGFLLVNKIDFAANKFPSKSREGVADKT